MASVPYPLRKDTKQICSCISPIPLVGKTIAFIDKRSKKLIIGERDIIEISMGDGVVQQEVVEFTIVTPHHYIVRNVYGIARDVYILGRNRVVYGEITENVMRVAGGEKLKSDGYSFVKGVTADGEESFVSIGINAEVDIIPNGVNHTVKKIDDENSNVLKIINDTKTGAVYSLTSDGKLFNGDIQIAEDVIDIGLFEQQSTDAIKLGNYPNVDNPRNMDELVRRNTKLLFSKGNVDASWLSEYDNYVSSLEHPTCMWAGVGDNNTHTKTISECVKFVPSVNSNNSKVDAILLLKEDGIYSVSGVKQVISKKDANGFRQLYEVDNRGKFILFPGIEDFDRNNLFEENEVNVSSNHIFIR